MDYLILDIKSEKEGIVSQMDAIKNKTDDIIAERKKEAMRVVPKILMLMRKINIIENENNLLTEACNKWKKLNNSESMK